MSEEQWGKVDEYFASQLAPDDDALRHALTTSREAGLPDIQITPTQGRLLQLLAKSVGAQRILEVGTLGGYSTIWLARALGEDGRLISLELEKAHARVAQANLANAGLSAVAEVRVGDARASLAELVAAGTEPFDFFFIDADKQSNPEYFAYALELSHPGTLIVVDNVVRSGSVADAQSTDASVVGVRTLISVAAADARVEGTAIQTVGAKGYDGFALWRVR